MGQFSSFQGHLPYFHISSTNLHPPPSQGTPSAYSSSKASFNTKLQSLPTLSSLHQPLFHPHKTGQTKWMNGTQTHIFPFPSPMATANLVTPGPATG